MVDTVRTLAQLRSSLFADGQGVGAITPQDMRDFVVSVGPLSGVINVKDFPYLAVGDGVTDDTAAIQAAVDAANTAGGGTVFVPVGDYKISSSIDLRDKPNIRLAGDGSGNPSVTGGPVVAYGTAATALIWAGSSGSPMIYAGATNGAARRPTGQEIVGLYLAAEAVADCGIRMSSTYFCNVRDVAVRDATQQGILLDAVANLTGDVEENQYTNISNFVAIVLHASAANMDGIKLTGNGTSGTSFTYMNNIRIQHKDGAGILYTACAGNTAFNISTSRIANGSGYGLDFNASEVDGNNAARRNGVYFINTVPQDTVANAGGIIARSGTFDSNRNFIFGVQRSDSAPLPTIEVGASLNYIDEDAITHYPAVKMAFVDDVADASNQQRNADSQNASILIYNTNNNHTRWKTDAGDEWDVHVDASGNFKFFRLSGTGKLFVQEAVRTQEHYDVDGTKVVGNQGAAVADASGGGTVDTEARAALNALLARLRTHGMIAT